MTDRQWTVWLYGLYCDMTIKRNAEPLRFDTWVDTSWKASWGPDDEYAGYVPQWLEYLEYKRGGGTWEYPKWIVEVQPVI